MVKGLYGKANCPSYSPPFFLKVLCGGTVHALTQVPTQRSLWSAFNGTLTGTRASYTTTRCKGKITRHTLDGRSTALDLA